MPKKVSKDKEKPDEVPPVVEQKTNNIPSLQELRKLWNSHASENAKKTNTTLRDKMQLIFILHPKQGIECAQEVSDYVHGYTTAFSLVKEEKKYLLTIRDCAKFPDWLSGLFKWVTFSSPNFPIATWHFTIYGKELDGQAATIAKLWIQPGSSLLGTYVWPLVGEDNNKRRVTVFSTLFPLCLIGLDNMSFQLNPNSRITFAIQNDPKCTGCGLYGHWADSCPLDAATQAQVKKEASSLPMGIVKPRIRPNNKKKEKYQIK